MSLVTAIRNITRALSRKDIVHHRKLELEELTAAHIQVVTRPHQATSSDRRVLT